MLPTEVHDRILDFVDNDTWKTCLVVSPKFRSYCLRKFRLDDRTNIVDGPFVQHPKNPRLSFDFEDTETGNVDLMTQPTHLVRFADMDCIFTPVIGSDRKVLMSNVELKFEYIR